MATLEEVTPDIRKVDKKHMFAQAEKLGATVTDVKGTSRALALMFVDLPASKLADCDNCGGQSDAKLSECPYCGVADDENMSTDDSVVPPPIGGAKVPSVLAAARTEKDLDAAVGRVKDLKANGGRTLWLLGKEIAAIYDNHLWKQRTTDEKPLYKSFEEFAKKEIGYAKTQAYWLMDVSKAFDEKLALEYGITKLGYILQAPKEDRNLLLDKMKAGAGAKELKEAATSRRKEKGGRELTRTKDARGVDIKKRSKSAEAAKAAKKTAKPKGDTITVAKILGRQQVKLWKRPEKKGAEPTARAKKIGDRPWGVLALENGVSMAFAVTTSSAGELLLIVMTEREKQAV